MASRPTGPFIVAGGIASQIQALQASVTQLSSVAPTSIAVGFTITGPGLAADMLANLGLNSADSQLIFSGLLTGMQNLIAAKQSQLDTLPLPP